jgi:hypothetical protein
MSRLPAPLALLVAAAGGAVTSLVLLMGVLSLTGATTEAHLMSLAGVVVVLPVGLVLIAAGFYVARRVYVTLRPPPFDPSEHEHS